MTHINCSKFIDELISELDKEIDKARSMPYEIYDDLIKGNISGLIKAKQIIIKLSQKQGYNK